MINDLVPARLDGRQAYENMSIMHEWMKTVNTTMNALELSMTRDQAAAIISRFIS